MTPSISIIGGGPGGLTLARILQVKNIPFTVYEHEASSSVRTQGGTLDLHQETGQKALEVAGLTAEFLKHARGEGEDTRILSSDGVIHYDEVNDDPDFVPTRPEIDRGDLRKILLDSIDPASIKWGKALVEVKESVDGNHVLHFKDGSTTTADLVVGCDGAWSRVRPLISAHRPVYSGVTYIEMHLNDVSVRHPDIQKFVGRGTLFACGDNRALIAQVNGNDRIRTYAMIRCDEKYAKETTFVGMTPDQEKSVVLGHFEGWDASLTRLIMDSEPGFVTRPLYELPHDALTWDHVPNVTLIGDAAHLMLPSGEGVNLAMLDAMELALSIASSPEDLDAAARRYEEATFKWTKDKSVESKETLDMLLEPEGPKQALEFFRSMMGGGPPLSLE
ncbi:hypothetical protein HKX48_008569 [Thoreauomyces humboldtii]|nr:hypothetical protein HKX48_008569 [Thoreauomyces humboldtii]